MTLTIKLAPKTEKWLLRRANQQGIQPAELASRLIEGLTNADPEGEAPVSMADFDALSGELHDIVDPSVPPLSEYALGRASFYDRD